LLIAVVAAGSAQAPTTDGWPQWGGPDRNFIVRSAPLLPKWPPAGPPVVWRRKFGEGHSSIVGDARRLYTMRGDREREFLIALNRTNGATAWEHAYTPASFDRMDLSYGRGPHATPVIHGNYVYAVGTTGRLVCVDRERGSLVWSHELWRDLDGTFIGIGYSSSPVVYRDTLIVQVGAPRGSLMAFDLKSGAIRWRAHDFRNSSSSPILISVDGREQVVAFMHNEVVGVDPASGALLWRHPVKATMGFHFNISTPVWGADNLLFVSAAYGVGGRALQLAMRDGRARVEELWQSERTRVHHENAIRIGHVIYVSTGHLGPAFLSAIDVRSGRVLWQNRSFSHATLLHADGRMIVLDEDGTLALTTPSPTGLTIHSRVSLLSSPTWTAPTLMDGVLYVRDRESLLALRVR
jgi:outer membrane protein assembly factor BamB